MPTEIEVIRQELLQHEKADEKNMANLSNSLLELSKEFHALNISLIKLTGEVSSRNQTIDLMDKRLNNLEKKLEDNFVRKDIFNDRVLKLERAVYGVAGTIILAVITGLLGLVLTK